MIVPLLLIIVVCSVVHVVLLYSIKKLLIKIKKERKMMSDHQDQSSLSSIA